MNCPIIAPKNKLAFNKKNATEFADRIYSENRQDIQFTKLCGDELEIRHQHDERGKVKPKSKLHCIVGEAYATFVKSSLLSISKLEAEHTSKWSIDTQGPTAKAIDALVEVAELKDKSDTGREALAHALNDCVTSNDDYIPSPTMDEKTDETIRYIIRAKKTAETWREQVLPLLK